MCEKETIRSTCLANAVISAGLSTLLPQINLCDPFGGEDKACAFRTTAEDIAFEAALQ